MFLFSIFPCLHEPMKHCRTILKILLFPTVFVHLLSADTHTLQYFYTAVTGPNLPEYIAVGLLNGEEFVYYDSNIREAIPKTEWIKKISADDPHFWDRETERQQGRQERFKVNVATAMQSFNQTKGVHTWQRMHGCELDDDGTIRGYTQYGCDGEDFISLDLKAYSWTAAKPQAVTTESKWESTGHQAKHCKDFLKYECIELLKKIVSYSSEELKSKVVPEVSVFQKHSSPSPEAVCHATGYFPKALNITWQKDGEDVREDVELRETLPNQDGSFQKRSILKVPAEELQKHTYTCVVQHSSLEKELVLRLSQILGGGGSEGETRIVQMGIIIGMVMAFIALAVAGILIWKMKSDFKPVPQNSTSSSEGDSSSNKS